MVYYSGHGLQIEGKAYLLGTGIKGTGDMSAALREYSESVDDVIRSMEEAAPSARVLIVDACRRINAFAANARRRRRRVPACASRTPTFSLPTSPGKTVPARADTSPQSPFTAGLLYAFENSDEGLEKTIRRSRARRPAQLNPDQNPQLHEVRFRVRAAAGRSSTAAAAPRRPRLGRARCLE